MTIRRPAWRLLRLYERLHTKPKPSNVKNQSASGIEEDAFRREQLDRLYEATISREKAPPNPIAAAGERHAAYGRCLAILVPSLPKHDRNSSALRIYHILRAMSSHFDEIHLVHSALTEDDPVYKGSYPENLHCHHIPFKNQKVEQFLVSAKPDMLFVTDLFDPQYIQQCSNIVKEAKADCPECFVLLDTMDCHWKKYIRKARISGNQEDWNAAWHYLDLEKELYPAADLITVVTEEDGKDIAFSIPGAAKAAVLPNCYTLSASVPDFDQTTDLCFVGPATVNHNLDAMRYMRDSILPYLLEVNNDIQVFVVGSSWHLHKTEFAGFPFVFRGHAANLDKELARYRVFVCPLTYGAGLKGKIGSAASAGIPVVSTSIGCEGYPISSSNECLISDNPKVFAQHCQALLTDRGQWENKRTQLRTLMEHNYGPEALGVYIAGILETTV